MRINASKIAALALALGAALALSSCKGDADKAPAPAAREIMKTYTDTLAAAPDKARAAAGVAEERNKTQEDALKGF